MPETFKAYVAEDWPHDAITIQVTHGAGMRGKTVGVVEHLPGYPDLPPLMRMVPILDLADEETGEPRSQAPRSGVRVPKAAAEAILVALLAWSSSTPGDNPVERAERTKAALDLALAEVAQLRHDLAVAQERVSHWEAASMLKDDTILAHRDHLDDLRRAREQAAWLAPDELAARDAEQRRLGREEGAALRRRFYDEGAEHGAGAVVAAVEGAYARAQTTTSRGDRPFWAKVLLDAARAAAQQVSEHSVEAVQRVTIYPREAAALDLESDDDYLDVVFDGPPSHQSGRFVEVENADGESVNAGKWIDRGNGLWALRITRRTTPPTEDRA